MLGERQNLCKDSYGTCISHCSLWRERIVCISDMIPVTASEPQVALNL